ncbi:MAG: peptidoglycan DD-metalloendopeptidase family protein [Thermonemataceae bacterium]
MIWLIRFFSIVGLYTFWITTAQAQIENRLDKDSMRVSVGKGKDSLRVTTSPGTTYRGGVEQEARVRVFDPKKELSIVAEDTSTLDEDITSIIQVSDFLKIDCVWVKAAEYYSIWNSKRINPYGVDAANFKDTLSLRLYDETKGQLWASPLHELLLTSHFGPRWGRFHPGTDLNLKQKEPVYALFDGIVRIAHYDRGYGYHVVLRHYNGLETLYGHFSALKCNVGQVVKAGQIIGLGGSTGISTGPHLHLEIRYAGHTINPAEICDFYDKENLIREEYFNLTPHHFRHLGNRTRKEFTYVVKSGDTLSRIARKYGVSISYLANINRISINSLLRVGQRLRVK